MSNPNSYETVSGLTEQQIAQFHHDGLLVVPDFFSAGDADRLYECAQKLVREFDVSRHPRTIFKTSKTSEQTKSAANTMLPNMSSSSETSSEKKSDYFLDSANGVSYFFEEHAFNDEGELVVPKEKAINKVGHYLHMLHPQFQEFTHRPQMHAVAKSLGLLAPIVLQSMVIYKQPTIGGIVDKHRDSTFLTTLPSSCIGFWFALEDCTPDNGCLWYVPGSHLDGSNEKRFQRQGTIHNTINNQDLFAYWNSHDKAAAASTYSAPNNVDVKLVMKGDDLRLDYPEEKFVCSACKKGTLVIIHGDVVHMSYPNRSLKSRNIYTFHMIEAFGTEYPNTNWLQMAEPFPHFFSRQQELENIRQHQERKAALATNQSLSQ